ncbi:P27 family phage terminase small subunit [Candidatus Contubernalis alkaliaceticus]|uniref:P27 family phage terminase small subunit n=1 Tax=Candidatus Contubernalis alkaliaceticus TaxID=338645 RepID=UPI001F4BF7E3|nr:P27 family phage terminase small subunit [Candidatus Contubernalis alkalaceticus]
MRVNPKRDITNYDARRLFRILAEELKASNQFNEKTLLLIDNMILLEQLKQDHFKDVQDRGVVELFKNGAQEMYRENKSVGSILKIVEQQRKLQAELKLTPASDKKVSKAVAQGDNFEDF